MSAGGNTPGMSKLARVLSDQMKRSASGDKLLDFGEIQADGSLITNTFEIPIPKNDYTVCRHLKGRSVTVNTSETSVGEHGSHRHEVSVQTRQALAAGDRVLVAWVGNDAVVIDVILSASDVL